MKRPQHGGRDGGRNGDRGGRGRRDERKDGGPRRRGPAGGPPGPRGPAPRRPDVDRPAAKKPPPPPVPAPPPPPHDRRPAAKRKSDRPVDDGKPSVFSRAHGGDWEAYEELLAQTVAPTFDAAVHLFEDAATAGAAAEEALFSLALAVRKAEFTAGDPLKFTARLLARGAKAAARSPFFAGLTPEDLTLLALEPTDGRGSNFAKASELARYAVVLDVALDLEPRDLAYALEKPEAEVAAALAEALDLVPAHDPRDAFRDVLDARAARFRLPPGIEDRVLDRLEATP